MPCIVIRNLVATVAVVCASSFLNAAERPNIVWIVVEDASANVSCYGEKTITTPAIDRLADEGVKFSRAFITCPVCSPSRSAMVSGMYQTTLGAHQHRSQRATGKGGVENDYTRSYALPESIRLIPEIFRDAGYFVTNGGKGKTDYNFIERPGLYDGKDWTRRSAGQPFFAQFQLHGGKNRGAKVPQPVDPADVNLPAHYPDDPVLRQDWARYLNSWIQTDREVAAIREQLESAGELENTVIFFWTDHGISHARGKQFLYDEGMHIPLIVRFPGGKDAGTIRDDLVQQIDVAAASLRLAGIEIPEYVQGRPIFDVDYRERRFVFSARDRCDETVDIIRAVRSKRYKYIRNFLPFVGHMQPNIYKDQKDIVQRMRDLQGKGTLTELQARIFRESREPEELYDLERDPHEYHNLLKGTPDEQREARDTANVMRLALIQWMIDSGDVGLIPEPVLEDLGREHGSKYGIRDPQHDSRMMWRLVETIEAGERQDVSALQKSLADEHPAIRWWGATWLGYVPAGQLDAAAAVLRPLLADACAGVRVAAAQSLCQLGDLEAGLPVLSREVQADNRVAGMYAIRGLELLGEKSRSELNTIVAAQDSPYEFTRRIASRLSATLAP